MKRFLIHACLIAALGSLASCSYFQQQDEEEPQESDLTEDTAETQQPEATPTITPTPTLPTYMPPSVRLNPFPTGVQHDTPGPDYLPGDDRPGLRAPKLPNILPYDIDGKLTMPAAQ